MKYAFWFHYNKPQSKLAGKPQITLHWKNVCHIVGNVLCSVPTRGRIRKRQPQFVMCGKAERIDFIAKDGDWIAEILF